MKTPKRIIKTPATRGWRGRNFKAMWEEGSQSSRKAWLSDSEGKRVPAREAIPPVRIRTGKRIRK